MRWNDQIGRRIKLSDLHILLAVAQSGSMAKAASALAVSHPVVSRSISDLEHTLGVRLLDRNPHGVELTEYGRAMLSRSHAVFDELRQGVKDIEFLSDPTVGEVRIGTTPATGGELSCSSSSTVCPGAILGMMFRVVAEGASQSDTSAESGRAQGRSPHLSKGRGSRRRARKLRVPFRKPLCRRSGCEQPLGQTAADCACGIDGKIVGTAGAGRPFGSFVTDAFRAGGLDYPAPP